MLRIPALIAGLLILASPAAAGPYDYDPARVGPPTLGAARTVNGVAFRPIAFASPTGNRVTGAIVQGQGAGPHPAVLFVHWLGKPETTNHTQFQADAAALAARGVTSLLVDAMWARPGWIRTMGASAEADHEATVNQVIDLRAALDILLAQPGVDPERVAFVGHDFGAMTGALLTAADDRPRSLVLMAGNPSFAEWYRFGKDLPGQEAYFARIGELDTLAALGAARAHAVQFQFARNDRFVPDAAAEAFFAAAPHPKGIAWYDADHGLSVPQAFDDRIRWLLARFDLD